MHCPTCGCENPEGSITCSVCGNALDTKNIFQSTSISKVKNNKTISKKLIAVIILLLLIIVMAIVTIIFHQFNSSKISDISQPFIYVTEKELYYCRDLNDGVESVCISNNYAGRYEFSNDNRYIFYSEGTEESNILYAFEWNKEQAEKIPIGKNIGTIEYVLGDSEKIYYTDLTGKELFCTDLMGNSQSIIKFADYISSPWLWASKGNAKYLIYMENKETEYGDKTIIYAVNTDDNSSKIISSNCDDRYGRFPGSKFDFNYADYDNITKIYFIEDNKLYVSDMLGNRKLISSEVRDVCVSGTNIYYQTIDNIYEDVYSKNYLYGDYQDDNENLDCLSIGSLCYYDELSGNNLNLLNNITAESIDRSITYGKNGEIYKTVYLRNCYNYDIYDFNFAYTHPYDNFDAEEGIKPIDFSEEYYLIKNGNAIKINTGYEVYSIDYCPDKNAYKIRCVPNGMSLYNEKNNDICTIYYLPENATSFDSAEIVANNVFDYVYTDLIKEKEIIFKNYYEFNDDTEISTMIIGKDEINNVFPYLYSDGLDLYYCVKSGGMWSIYKYSNGKKIKVAESYTPSDFVKISDKYYTLTDYENDICEITCFTDDKQYKISSNIDDSNSESLFMEEIY